MADAMRLPVPHIEIDGSVNSIDVVRHEGRDWLSIQDSNQSIMVSDANHARAIARALNIAADLLEQAKKEGVI